MIEVLFGESEAGSMKAAKNKAVIGKTDEVVCLGFLLDIGDIREELDSDYRRELIYSLYAQGQWGEDEEINEELRNVNDFYCNELDRLKDFLEDGQAVRVWYSGAPYSLCGFCHLCGILKEYENEVRAVRLPEYILGASAGDASYGKKIRICHNWGEVAAEEFAGFLTEERTLAREEIRMYAWLWSELKQDNSPLRSVINGRVTGVPESFYDFLIFKRLTEEPVKEARLIGDILGSCPLGVGDWWYAKRIEEFIREGRIKVIEDSENKYARVISLEQPEFCQC